jgi:hypothetical protein
MRILMLISTVLLQTGLPAQESPFMFKVGESKARPGGSFSFQIFADAPVSYQGFSLSVRCPRNELAVDRVGVEGTILEAIHADFIDATVLPSEGLINLGVLVDVLPPFEGNLIPAIGMPLEMAHATGTVLRESTGEIKLPFDRTAQRPAVANVFSVENYPVTPDQLVDGVLTVEEAPKVPAFIRGDANVDRRTDVSDVIFILATRFLGASGPQCDDASDVNSDMRLDISDGIYLLSFLYQDGQSPLPPQGAPGPNPLANKLGCKEPLEWFVIGP